ncbi:hypothetical protein DL770_003492 [Monosporascus sp. CRB-9-2]|nr:hypothetical protein DL770_003492 [Monosporascus sp. CRB-9-2]
MGLVDYSDSESDAETPAQPQPKAAPAPGAKKFFQKVVDRSKSGKILVNLPQTSGRDESETTNGGDQPPAKRQRTGGGGGGAFSNFNSFLPPPKNTGKPAVASGSGKSAPKPGINLKTGAAPGFSRESDGNSYDEMGARVGNADSTESSRSSQQPSIPEGQKPAEEVKLVGKPMMFKPLSVSRKPAKKNVTKAATGSKPNPTASTPSSATTAEALASEAKTKEQAPKKKVSLFSISDEPEDPDEVESAAPNASYEPMFTSGDDISTKEAFAQYDAQYANFADPQVPSTTTGHGQSDSLEAIASEMNLSAAARRELFGRRGAPGPAASATKVVNFNTDLEYAHNEELRASGEQQTYNPVRAIAPGKHNLRQLVNNVHSQREALEESFAKAKSNKNEAGAKYGWR